MVYKRLEFYGTADAAMALRPSFWKTVGVALAAGMLSACSLIGLDDFGTAPQTRAGAASRTGVEMARQMRTQGDFDGATKVLGQLLLTNPDDPAVVGEYGKVLLEQGRAGEAVTFLNRAIMLDRNDWKLYSALGVAFDGVGDSLQARSAYERALKLKPDDPVILNNYAMSRLMAGDSAGAKTLIHQAAAVSKDPKITRNLSLIEDIAPKGLTGSSAAGGKIVSWQSILPRIAAHKPSHRPTGRDFAAND